MNKERTNWRDENISKRHRCWGVQCPANDIDFVLIERKYNNPVALTEYKNEHCNRVNLNDGSIIALSKLGTMAGIPCFLIIYKDNFSAFAVCPINDMAKNMLQLTGSKYIAMTERDYVGFMYKIRNDTMDWNSIQINITSSFLSRN